MRRDRLWTGTFGIALLTLATLACDDTAKGVKKDAEEAKPYVDAAAAEAKDKLQQAAEAAKPAAEEAGAKLKELGGKAVEGAKELGDKAADGARKAGDKIEDGADKAGDKIESGADRAGDKTARGAEKAADKTEDAGDAVSAAAQTTMVKAALVADKSVDASRIDVDTEGGTKTVMLKGSVPSAAMKATAERIAKAKVSKGYSVHNMLTVAKP